MDFADFAERAAVIEAEPADLAIVEHVVDLFEASGDDLPIVARFVQGRVFPAWDSTTLDIGPASCYAAIARAAGQNVSVADVEDRLAEVGDVGEVAASFDLGGQTGLAAFAGKGGEAGGGSGATDRLTVREVDETLRELAAVDGAGSESGKVNRLFGLFTRCSSTEARYLARLVLSEMRIGVGEGTVRDAIADAFDVPVDEVERALQVSNDYGRVAEVARDDGADGLAELDLTVGRPVQAMLAQAGTITDALEDWDEVAVEWKYDGARVQLHYDGEETGVFSRNMEDVTSALPEVVAFADAHLDAPCILDGEVVAIDDEGDPLPFQEVLRRFRRKHDVERAQEEVPVSPVFFDCLHRDGVDLLDVPLTKRHEHLEALLAGHGDSSSGVDPSDVDGLSLLWLTDDPELIAEVEADSLEAGHEGIMLKDPDSTYSPGRRGKHWRKIKPDVETLDLVVTGAEWGEGRRAKLLGTFQLSVRTDDGYETIGNVATGITDAGLAELTELLEPHVIAQEGQTVDLEPAVVFEVGYEEIQRSPTYSSGYALRFPRFVAVRDDKDPADADTLQRVETLAG